MDTTQPQLKSTGTSNCRAREPGGEKRGHADEIDDGSRLRERVGCSLDGSDAAKEQHKQATNEDIRVYEAHVRADCRRSWDRATANTSRTNNQQP